MAGRLSRVARRRHLCVRIATGKRHVAGQFVREQQKPRRRERRYENFS